MRTSDDFDRQYQSPDPWRIGAASHRDKALASIIAPYVPNQSVLELGCGEGHLTASIFRAAKSVRGVDISTVAISRALALSLQNCSFVASDFLNVSFIGYDVIAAIECVYYLSTAEQAAFFEKLIKEHAGGVFILSGPIIGSNVHRTYFTHAGIEQTFARYGMTMIEWRNLNVNRQAGMAAAFAAVAVRLPFGNRLLPLLHENWVYQRCYVARCPIQPGH